MTEEKNKTEQKTEEKPKEEKSKVELSQKAQDIMTSIEGMSVLELSGLVKAMEDKFGVSSAMPTMAVAGAAGTAGAGAAAAEEKSTFNVVLAEVGANKIQVIKEIRAVTSLGLKEAKELVDSAPKAIKEGIPREEAEEIKKKVEASGAKVELK